MATEFHNLQELRQSPSLATKVFIQRDYSEGTVCRFQIKFPSELGSRIERTLFEDTVKTLNSYYAEAEKVGGQSYMEGCLACATAYFIFLCMETRYEKLPLCLWLLFHISPPNYLALDFTHHRCLGFPSEPVYPVLLS
ncbi:golgin subfamily A member 7B-like isoform X2 [Oncorhynchus keta]|uniref:golgin subfamily A member 7B-like isoform X2 n=1 Tax=Oncorhynchus keta TaxID=8018 RepID=UPI0015F8BDC9|nr:golgin subfamily A member 7B-like isoform X2 [Oncorhynchus keta]